MLVPGGPCPVSHEILYPSPYLPSQSLPKWHVSSIPACLLCIFSLRPDFSSWQCWARGQETGPLSCRQAHAFCKHLLNVYCVPEAASGPRDSSEAAKISARFLPVAVRMQRCPEESAITYALFCVLFHRTMPNMYLPTVVLVTSLRYLHNNQGSQK